MFQTPLRSVSNRSKPSSATRLNRHKVHAHSMPVRDRMLKSVRMASSTRNMRTDVRMFSPPSTPYKQVAPAARHLESLPERQSVSRDLRHRGIGQHLEARQRAGQATTASGSQDTQGGGVCIRGSRICRPDGHCIPGRQRPARARIQDMRIANALMFEELLCITGSRDTAVGDDHLSSRFILVKRYPDRPS